MRTGTTAVMLSLAVSVLALSFSAYSGETATAQRAVFPKVLRGVWDVAPYDCSASDRARSDTMFKIGASSLRGYENTDALKSIQRISASPLTWRVVAISNVAPPEIQGGADIYIMDGNKLTISNGSTAEIFIRCK